MTVLFALLVGALATLVFPDVALAHSLAGRVDTPLPFVAYVGGAAVAVGLSFFFIAISDPGPPRDEHPAAIRVVPRWLRLFVRGVGLFGWLWIVVQTLIGGSSDADVSDLFLWVYGWVGLAIISGLIGPLWSWLDPFSTLHDPGAALLRRTGVEGVEPQPIPARLGIWPAIAGICFFIWLELVAQVNGGQVLGFVLIGYTMVTLVGMAQYGKSAWRLRGETFSVWFGLLGRLAPFGTVGEPEEGRIHRRPFASALISNRWTVDRVVLVTLAAGSILYDGASQTAWFRGIFGFPNLIYGTLLLGTFLGLLTGIVLLVSRKVGLAAVGAGLVPVALGYLFAHYFSFLFADGQRILVALSDPFQQGWNLIGFLQYQPNISFLPNSLVWGFQVAAVVLGHVVGAWAGHAAVRGSAANAAPAAASGGARARAGKAGSAPPAAPTGSQLPLAILMICLTSATLWSLGQNLVFAPPPTSTTPASGAAPSAVPTVPVSSP